MLLIFWWIKVPFETLVLMSSGLSSYTKVYTHVQEDQRLLDDALEALAVRGPLAGAVIKCLTGFQLTS